MHRKRQSYFLADYPADFLADIPADIPTDYPAIFPVSPAKRIAQRGFTLIELMVVIVILGILAGIIVPNFMSAPGEAKQAKARVEISAIETALKMYKLHIGTYPTTEQGLQALVEPPASGNTSKWKDGGYLEKGKVPADPWGNDYVYLSPGVHGDFDITSYGLDGVPGGEGENKDINSWEIE